jgi:hypothetical protein
MDSIIKLLSMRFEILAAVVYEDYCLLECDAI